MGSLKKVAGGYLGAKGAREQKHEIRKGTRKARRAADPFWKYRKKYAKRFDEFVGKGFTFDPTEDPSAKFRFAKGKLAIERGAASGGFLKSGRLGVALTEYGQDFASEEFGKSYGRWQDQFNRLGMLSGATTANLANVGNIISGGATQKAELTGREWAAKGQMFSGLMDLGSSAFSGGMGGGGGFMNPAQRGISPRGSF